MSYRGISKWYRNNWCTSPPPPFHALFLGHQRINTYIVILVHYSDVIMGAMASQITRITFVYSTFHSGADQGNHQSSAPLAFVRGMHWWPVNCPHKWPVTRQTFPFDDIIMSGNQVGSLVVEPAYVCDWNCVAIFYRWIHTVQTERPSYFPF